MKQFLKNNAAVFLATVFFISCQPPVYLAQKSTEYYLVQGSVSQDSAMLAMLAPYKAGVDTQMQVVIGHTDIPLTKSQPECTLGNFISDAQWEAAKKIDPKVVASVMNYGGIRLSYMAPGMITKGKIYELMPFDNMLTIIEIPGDVVKQFCDHIAKAKGWPVSGISFIIKDKTAMDIIIDGKPLNENIVYKMAVSDYIARGGDNCDFLSPLKKRFTKIFVRDAMIEYLAQLESNNQPLHPQIEKRVRYAE